MTIDLPHINYKIHVKEYKSPPDSIPNALAYVKRNDMYSCTIFIKKGQRKVAPDLAHELIHVMQFICLDRNIDFCTETEHMGYTMHYLLGKIMGYKWE